jgi:hypothetical protein
MSLATRIVQVVSMRTTIYSFSILPQKRTDLAASFSEGRDMDQEDAPGWHGRLAVLSTSAVDRISINLQRYP